MPLVIENGDIDLDEICSTAEGRLRPLRLCV
jgi:hypothetical protein